MARKTTPRRRAALLAAWLAVTLLAMAVNSPVRAESPLATLYRFSGGADGANPTSSVLEHDGTLYGTTTAGGAASLGTVYRLAPSKGREHGWTETVLHSFAGGSDGATPYAGLVADRSGRLYGTTVNGGTHGKGTVFQLTPPTGPGRAWAEVVLYSFAGGTDGANPHGDLLLDRTGTLYGTTTGGGLTYLGTEGGTVFRLTPPSSPSGHWTETVLHRFPPISAVDGSRPFGNLVADATGALYGTTEAGGTLGGGGTAFRLTPPGAQGGNWTETLLRSFGFVPIRPTGLLLHEGAAYVTLSAGHFAEQGAIARLTPPAMPGAIWDLTILHTYAATITGRDIEPEGTIPMGAVLADRAGALYGTTILGGTGCLDVIPPGCGVIYKLTSSPMTPYGQWSEAVLHSFTGDDGAQPSAALIFGCHGDLYGTTEYGGTGYAGNASSGHGTVFSLSGPHGRLAPFPKPGSCGKSGSDGQ